MNEITKNKLKMLEAKHKKQEKAAPQLKVYYGFSKINKIQKREAICIDFENEQGAGSENSRSGKSLRKRVEIVAERFQTPGETADAAHCNRVFTEYLIFMDDKRIGGSLEKALRANIDADSKNVPMEELKTIADKLRREYLATHPDYREPSNAI